MSLLVNQPSKLCFPKPVFARSSPILCRRVSQPSQLCFQRSVFVRSSPTLSDGLLQSPPCFIGKEQDFVFLANSSTHLGKKVPLEFYSGNVKSVLTIGSSHGWVASLKDGRVLLHDDLNPIASETDPKRISLPPLVSLPHCQTQIITNVSMSSPSPKEEDCVVAVKFLGPQISFCRPAQKNSQWTNIRLENPCFFSSRVMFSKSYSAFRIPGSGGLIESWDVSTHQPNLENFFNKLRFRNLPNLSETKRELLHSCCRSELLVESESTDEIFLIKWYKKTTAKGSMKTRALMVFKLEEGGNAIYTQDIGDLCIFLSESEPFCVPATSFPPGQLGLCSNSVVIHDLDEIGMVNLDDSSIDTYNCTPRFPYLIPPQNIVK